MDTASAEPTTNPPEHTETLFGGKKHLFNPETARLAALKRYELERQAKLPAPAQPLSMHNVCSDIAQPTDSYTSTLLPRVRVQLDRLAGKIATEEDPARLDRLAAAFGKLSEVERQLAGRPLPGSLRPSGKPMNAGMIEQPTQASPASSPPAVESDGQE